MERVKGIESCTRRLADPANIDYQGVAKTRFRTFPRVLLLPIVTNGAWRCAAPPIGPNPAPGGLATPPQPQVQSARENDGRYGALGLMASWLRANPGPVFEPWVGIALWQRLRVGLKRAPRLGRKDRTGRLAGVGGGKLHNGPD